MTQGRFNALAILNSTKSLVDKLPLVAVGSDLSTVNQIAEMILEISQRI